MMNEVFVLIGVCTTAGWFMRLLARLEGER